MRILFDECVPRPLRRHLVGHKVRTIQEMGWAGKTNGELLPLIAANPFDVFLTVDQNLKYQQNLRAIQVAVLVLVAGSNHLRDLLPLVPATLAALATIKPGDYVEIS